jgi:hypothetical protein
LKKQYIASKRRVKRESDENLRLKTREWPSSGPAPVLLGWLLVGIGGAWVPASATVESADELRAEYQESMVYGTGSAAGAPLNESALIHSGRMRPAPSARPALDAGGGS